jgi:hypothetical protein
MADAWQQLQRAVRVFTGDGSQREQLMDAYPYLTVLRPKDVPKEVRDEFEKLLASIPQYPPKNIKQAIKREVESLAEAEVPTVINTFMSIYNALEQYQPLLPSKNGSNKS